MKPLCWTQEHLNFRSTGAKNWVPINRSHPHLLCVYTRSPTKFKPFAFCFEGDNGELTNNIVENLYAQFIHTRWVEE